MNHDYFKLGQKCESDVVVEVFTGSTFEQERFKPAPFYSGLNLKREFPANKNSLFCAWESTNTKDCMLCAQFQNLDSYFLSFSW